MGTTDAFAVLLDLAESVQSRDYGRGVASKFKSCSFARKVPSIVKYHRGQIGAHAIKIAAVGNKSALGTKRKMNCTADLVLIHWRKRRGATSTLVPASLSGVCIFIRHQKVFS